MGDHRDPELLAALEDAAPHGAIVEHAEPHLHGGDRGQLGGLVELAAVDVREPDAAYEALLGQPRQRPRRRPPRRARIRRVEQVHVDRQAPERLEARLAVGGDRPRPAVGDPRAGGTRHPPLGEDPGARRGAGAAQGGGEPALAEAALGVVMAVRAGRVEHGDPRVHGGGDGRGGTLLLALLGGRQAHAAEADAELPLVEPFHARTAYAGLDLCAPNPDHRPMRAIRAFSAVDSHTEGMPTRVVTGGVGVLPGDTMLERKLRFERERDGIRRLLMREPRGHGAMSGAILQPPCRPDADWGVVFIEVSGCLPMCGHGTIGVATVLVETGMVDVREPETIVRLDVPAGLVEARVRVRDGRAESVTLRNVPAFVQALDCEAAGVRYDMVFGGNFYAIADAASAGLSVSGEHADELIAAGLELMAAVPEPVHPADAGIRGCRHVIWTAPPRDGADGRAATAIHPGWIDRSPCGTGTSARMALLWSRGELTLGSSFVNESIIGTRFTGRLVEEVTVGGRPAVVPEISGRAWITGLGTYLLDPDDPFPEGFTLGA